MKFFSLWPLERNVSILNFVALFGTSPPNNNDKPFFIMKQTRRWSTEVHHGDMILWLAHCTLDIHQTEKIQKAELKKCWLCRDGYEIVEDTVKLLRLLVVVPSGFSFLLQPLLSIVCLTVVVVRLMLLPVITPIGWQRVQGEE
jgi:hypothetical protein